jgi:putative nucleotidyltransferase with HDIG domain
MQVRPSGRGSLSEPMRKKIDVRHLRPGMYVDGWCGAWMSHPFWRTRFLLADAAELAEVHASGVAQCWIDTDKGLDVGDPPPAPAAPPEPTPPPQQIPAPAAATTKTSLEEELQRTVALLNTSRAAVMEMFSQARMGRAVDAQTCLPLVEDIAASVARNGGALLSLARLKTHDDYSYMHSVAVCALMIALARQLGQNEGEIREAGVAGLLHDLGKAKMPIDVLNKPGKLSDAEFTIIKSHPERGHELLQQAGQQSALVLDVCLHHHEKMNGTGYPHGLKEGEISLAARMGAVCDVYDAITSNRPYKQGWDPAESIARMAEWRRGHFDEAVFQAFVKSLGIYPTGSLVRMRSGRLAVVVEQHPVALTTPIVKVFFSTRSQMHIPPELIDLSRPGCSDAIAGRESNRQWNFARLDELWAGADVLRQAGR